MPPGGDTRVIVLVIFMLVLLCFLTVFIRPVCNLWNRCRNRNGHLSNKEDNH